MEPQPNRQPLKAIEGNLSSKSSTTMVLATSYSAVEESTQPYPEGGKALQIEQLPKLFQVVVQLISTSHSNKTLDLL
jgi:hypothetical protein